MEFSSLIRAVTFDVGGTLIEPWPSVGHVYASVAAEHGWKHLSIERIDRQFQAAWRAREEFNYRESEWAELVDQAFDGLLSVPPSRSFFPEIFQRFAQPGVWRIHDDVLPALERLASAGLTLAVVSNWDERLRPLLEQLALAPYFEFIVVSCEVGFHKPSPVIFEEALRKLGLPAGQVLHVGDSTQEDFYGATRAGLRAVLIDRQVAEPGLNQIRSLLDVEAGFLPTSSDQSRAGS